MRPMKEARANYAIKYGEKFCQLYDKHYDSFSMKGKNWINQVRKCLQIELSKYYFGQL